MCQYIYFARYLTCCKIICLKPGTLIFGGLGDTGSQGRFKGPKSSIWLGLKYLEIVVLCVGGERRGVV